MAQAGSLQIEYPARVPRLVAGYLQTSMPTNGQVETTNDIIVDVPVIDPKYADPTNWPADSRPEVQAIYAFAKVVKPYRFDPTVNSGGQSKSAQVVEFFDTPTHIIYVDAKSRRLDKFASKFDRLGSMVVYSDATDDWGDATGQWDQPQMIAETFRILRDLGPTYAETLKAVSQGRSEVKLYEWRIQTTDGQFKIIYPFATVKLYDTKVPVGSGDDYQTPRVTAQYRMGPDGPVGLVDWFSLY